MNWLKTLKIKTEMQRSIKAKGVVVLVLGIFLTSCATTSSYQNIKIPAFAGAYFSDCNGKDGSVSIEVYEESKVQKIFDADWSSDDSGDFSLASYSPLGQTIFQLDYIEKSKEFKQTGKPFEAFRSLSVGNRNIIRLDNYELGVRADELACFLNQKLPQRWLKRIVKEEPNTNLTRYIIHDTNRVITVDLPKNGNKSEENWTAKIEWSLYWGFKNISLNMKLLRDEQALVFHSSRFDRIDVRIIAQEE
jgi:hypothetical protein